MLNPAMTPDRLRNMTTSSGLPQHVVTALLEAADEIERLCRVEEDHKNVLKAALHNEPNGIDLVHRLATHAIRERSKV